MYYMVFAGQKHEGKLHWSAPVGVFETDKAEEACQAAAKKVGWMGSYFAVEGFPWGIDLLETDATEFGADSNVNPLENRIRELERSTGISGAS